jgi:hypothetical protein
VIGADGKEPEKKLSSGWTSLQGILWSPAGDEVWFTSTNNGSAENPRAVTLSGKLRTITNVPGGMWLEDLRNGTVLTVTNHERLGSAAWRRAEKKSTNWDGSDGRSCATSAATATRSYSKKKAMAADRTTPCFCAIPMDRLRHALARASRGDLARWKMGDHETGEGRTAEPGADGSGRIESAHP